MTHYHSDTYQSFSAGTKPSGVNPFSIKALEEIGFNTSELTSKSTDEFQGTELDYVVTVCDNAKEDCPVFLGGKTHIHHSFTDPSRTQGTDEEKLQAFRNVRDQIKVWLDENF